MLKYDSGMTAAALITQLKSEADISYPIPDASWVMWLNTVEQLLYGEIADDLRVVSYESSASYGSFDLGNITVSADCRDVRFDDTTSFTSTIGIDQGQRVAERYSRRQKYCRTEAEYLVHNL